MTSLKQIIKYNQLLKKTACKDIDIPRMKRFYENCINDYCKKKFGKSLNKLEKDVVDFAYRKTLRWIDERIKS